MSKKPNSYKPKTNSKARKFTPSVRKVRQSMYNNKDWTTYRFRYLHHNPKCYCCGHKSTVVDHVVSHKGDEKLFWNVTNYIPTCRTCHNTITASFDRHAIQRIEEKMKWIARQRLLKGVNIKVKIVEKK